MRFLKSALLVILISFLLSATATADEWNRATTAIFNNPVRIPGQVLPPGIYVFKLAQTSGDRNVIQIWNAEETALIAQIFGWPDYLRRTPGDSRFIFDEGEKGGPLVLKAWIYRGNTHVQTFNYNRKPEYR
jgi:hypothetical protein